MSNYKIPGSNLTVSEDGSIYTTSGEVCELPTHNGLIEIEMFGKTRHADKLWLTNVSICGIEDERIFRDITFVKIVGKKRGFQYNIIQRRVWEHPRHKCFRITPMFVGISVDNRGTVIDTSTGEQLKPHDNRGYYQLSLYTNGITSSIKIHRLVAMCWVHNPRPDIYFVVNHLDGNPRNNHYSNLEWTDHAGNNKHAVDTGLRPSCCKCRARNIHTDEILEFPSIVELNKFLGMKRGSKTETTFRGLRANKLYHDTYEIRVGDDTRPWVYDKNTVNIEPSRYIITVVDGETILKFNGPRQLIKHYKLWNTSSTGLSTVLSVMRERYPDLQISVVDQYTAMPLEVMNITTGEVKTFIKIKDIVKTLHLNKSSVIEVARSNGRKVFRGYRIRYTSSDPWSDVEENRYVPRRIEVTDKQTQHRQVFTSLRDAERSLNLSRKAIGRYLAAPAANDDYIIQYAM